MRLGKARRVREKRVRIEQAVAQEFEQLAVISIRTRSRHHIDDRAAAVAELRIEIGLLNFELLNRLHRRDVNCFLDARVVITVGYADTIEQEICLSIPASVGDEVRDE